MIICLGREFGSGGHEIGKQLSEILDVPFYDRQLVDMVIQRSELISDAIEKADEKKANSFLYRVWYETIDTDLRGLSANDILFKLQSEAIIEFAQSGKGVFVGRCADYVLSQAGVPHISMFISAPFLKRVERKMKLLHMDEKSVTALVRKTDKQRKAYYNYYTGGNWGKPDNYDFCVNSSSLEKGQMVQMLKVIMERYCTN